MMTTSNEHNNAPAVPQGEPEAYMVYGNYTRQPFRSIESAQAYMGGLLKSDPEGGYHIRPLFYATPATPAPAPAVPQGWRLVPVWLLERVEQSLGSFTSDEGWSQSDMDTMDSVSAMLAATPAPAPAQGEPFGYFRAEPFGWTDCSEDAEGAIALYEHPAKPAREVATLSLAAEDVHAAFAKNFPKSRISQAWISFAADIAQAIAARAAAPKPAQEVGQAIEAGTTVKEDYYLKAYNLSKQLADHLSVCPAPSQPVAPTDEQALKDAFEEGYCARSTYNDVDTSDCETEFERSSTRAAALRAKGGK